MDIGRDPHCGLRALLLIIWSIIIFSVKGDFDTLVLSPNKGCSNPNIIGCLPCSQDNLMGSYFDTRSSLSDQDFSIFLYQKIQSGDTCEGLIENTDIVGLSSLHRHLIGEGSHRQLITTMIFCHLPKLTHLLNEQSCEAVIIEHLPTGVFADPFELQHLVSREAFLAASVLGDTNLELPSALSNRSVVEIHINVKSENHKVVVQLPLHARYPPLDSSGYANITIGEPDLLLRCRPKETKIKTCSWTFIDLGSSSVANVTWRIPCGNEMHTRAVTIITFLSALVCSLLIVLSSMHFSHRERQNGTSIVHFSYYFCLILLSLSFVDDSFEFSYCKSMKA